MSDSKRKRRLSEKSELQLPLERRQQIKKLFEKKFTYRKPSDGSWCLPQDACVAGIRTEEQNQHIADQSEFLNKTCDGNLDQSESLGKSVDQNENSNEVLAELWKEEKYIGMKNELNKLKNNLNDKDLISWHKHTRSVNPAGGILPEVQHSFKPELCTQAWCKFYEIATTYLDLSEKSCLFSVHLCEAPGAFVTSLNHFMLSTEYEGDWDWIATTLNPYYEGNENGFMIADDRFIRNTEDNWYFGVDNTGNLMSQRNLEGLKKLIGDKQVDLVTADGSIDCQGDPAEQENVVSRLQHCEALTALHILSLGGDFVLKMFTMFECKAISLMYLLNCVFEEVHVFKPCTSKGGNSEVYVICQNFQGINDSQFLKGVSSIYFDMEPEGCLFNRSHVPASFLSQHTECNSFFKELQMTSIQRNLDLYKELSEEETQILEAEKQFCTECFFQRYKIVPMVHQWRIMKYKKRPHNQAVSNFEKKASCRENEGRFCGSFDDRLLSTGLSWEQKVREYKTYHIAEEEFGTWIENPHGQLESSELQMFETAFGQPVEKIQSSRFCYGKLIQQTQEIIHNVKWISKESSVENEMLMAGKVKKLTAILASHKNTDPVRNSASFWALEEKLTAEQPKHENTQTVSNTKSYSVCSEGLHKMFELNDQAKLLETISSIMETLHKGEDVIIELRTCLTRMTAGLVYILYRCFQQIGLMSFHGDLLKQYLVCLSYNINDPGQYDIKDYVKRFCALDTNEAGYSKLEIIPINYLLKDSQFCSFLQTANTRLLKSFVTAVVEKERTLLSENSAVT